MAHAALFLLCVLLGESSAIIYKLNDTDYAKMPPVFYMDPYDFCFIEPGGMYCTVELAIVSDHPSPLLDMMTEYSELTAKHFNHTKLTRGVCVTNSCTQSNSTDLRLKLESCFNDTMWSKYGLKTKVLDKFYCEEREAKMDITATDYAVAGCILFLLLLNIFGSCYDFGWNPGKDGINFLLCFSVRRNWRRLVAPSADGPEPRLKRLKSFNGFKTIVMFLVIMAHSMIISGYFVDNITFVEKAYDNFGYHLILNGTVIVQTFFIISGCLLSYNMQLYAEKHKLNPLMIIKATVLRWLRLTPSYAVVLGFVATWYRFLGTGPVWQKVIGSEAAKCQQTWWYHLLYLNNYVEASDCMPHTWYLAADTQLYILGVIVCVTCSSTRSRAVVLSLLLIAGIAIPSAITYYKDLDGALIPSPEATRNFYITDPTYMQVYIPGYTNMPNYVLGLALGYIIYHAQLAGVDPQKYKKYRILVWMILPVGISWVWSGSIFYMDAPRLPLIARVAAAALIKPVYGLLVSLVIGASVLRLENYYRGVVEWRGWTSLSRVTYSAYLFHYPFIRYFVASQVSLLHMTFTFVSELFFGTIVISYIAAFPIFLLVEAPLGQLVKICFAAPQKEKNEPKSDGKPLFIRYNTRPNVV